MKKLIIMRGIPGSGKSTKAAELAKENNGVIASVDHFFERTGTYEFDKYSVGHSYGFCEGEVAAYMKQGHDTIIADGVHSVLKRLEVYADLAKTYGYKVEYVYPDGDAIFDPQACYEHSVHNVPLQVIKNIAANFEREAVAA